LGIDSEPLYKRLGNGFRTLHACITKRHIASLVNNGWEIAMLFLTYWELNENFTPKDVACM